jgi:glyoxalase family protein
MNRKIKGIHHITAIAGNAKRNLDFYTRVLGLRLVKKTVNFDDPGTYHFYFGNEAGDPGTIMTFFPWEGIIPGRRGTGQATETAFAVPEGSLDFWKNRLADEDVIFNNPNPSRRLDEKYLSLLDPDGLKIELVETSETFVNPYHFNGVPDDSAIRGFHNTTLMVRDHESTADLLTSVFGYKLIATEGNRYRYSSEENVSGHLIDLVRSPSTAVGHVAGGSVHHVAFRTVSLESQLEVRKHILDFGLHPTDQINRHYFMSIYFREPQGILFEIATDPPGFTVDEELSSLGGTLKLPEMYEVIREKIETSLPVL